MALEFLANQKVAGVLEVLDTVTNSVVPATFSGTTATSDNPAAFTASTDSAGNVVVTGVAAGTGNLTVSSTAAYTNSLGQSVTAPLTASPIQVTVDAVPTADGVILQVQFGAPEAQ